MQHEDATTSSAIRSYNSNNKRQKNKNTHGRDHSIFFFFFLEKIYGDN